MQTLPRPTTFALALAFIALSSISTRSSLFAQDAASATTGPGVFPPTTQDRQALWSQLDAASQAEDWERVVTTLEKNLDLLTGDPKGRNSVGGDPVGSAPNEVISNGAGISLGVRRLLTRYVRKLPEEFSARFAATFDGAVRTTGEDTQGDLTNATRRALRHRILRDLPQSSFHVDALREEIDDRLLVADWSGARRVSELLLARPKIDPADRVRALLVALQADQALGDADSAKARVEKIRDAVTGTNDETEVFALARRVIASIRKDGTGGTDEPIEVFDDSASLSRFERAYLQHETRTTSPFLDPVAYAQKTSRAGRPGDEDSVSAFRLGTDVWRREAGDHDLRQFVAERRRERDGSISEGIDVPIPFHAAASEGCVLFQHDRQAVAYELTSGRLLWTLPLGASDGGYTIPRVPLTVDGTTLLVQGSEITAVELDTGDWLWSRYAHYDLDEQRLIIHPTRMLARSTPKVVTPPKRPANGNAGQDGDDDADGEEPEGDDDDAPNANEEPDANDDREDADQAGTPIVGVGAVHDGSAIFPVHVRSGQHLLCYLVRIGLDGSSSWTTFLGSTASSGYLGLGANASPPKIIGGQVLHLTNLGFVASVDVHDGVILWIKEYESLTTRGQREAIRNEDRWHPNPILQLSEDRILVAPQDSTNLLALHVESGATLWQTRREAHSTLIGSDASRCFLAGRHLSAIGISDETQGRTLWRRKLSSTPQGRALVTGDRLLVTDHEAGTISEIRPR